MTDLLRAALVVVLLFAAYRQYCQARYHHARLRARFGPVRGVRIVYRRGGRVAQPAVQAGNRVRRTASAPFRSTSGHLRLVASRERR